MANLVLASKRELKSGMFWHVYRSENNNKSEEFYFANPLKALRYAFFLRSRHNAIIPKGVYGKLMADVKASKSESAPAQEQSTALGTTAESENTAPVESTEQAPAESKAKRTPRKRTAKKANTEPSTESK